MAAKRYDELNAGYTFQANYDRSKVQMEFQAMSPVELSRRLKLHAAQLGFQLTGICPAVSPAQTTLDRLDAWIAAGYAGQMDYMAARIDAYQNPSHLLEGIRSLVMLGMHYRTLEPALPGPTEGHVSRYAWGERDYHDTIRHRLHQLADTLRESVPQARTRCVVDTAPLLEREFAQLAGLGWIGKNTMLISKEAGSYFFLAALLTTVPLHYDKPTTTDHCGTCTACLDACPTDAFAGPHRLDASRCISYLTIEHRESIPLPLRPGIGDWLFGCDRCQEVCPWNRKAPQTPEDSFRPREGANPYDLLELFEMDEAQFRHRFRHTPIWRAHRRGLLRNAAIVLGNHASGRAIPALTRGLTDPEPLVRGASAWALGQIPSREAGLKLQRQLALERDQNVAREIEAALRERRAES
jgi:epoxyqueuosine reductase